MWAAIGWIALGFIGCVVAVIIPYGIWVSRQLRNTPFG